MPNYQKTLIYKLICNDTNITQFYVGHTTNFYDRKRCHKTNCYNEKNRSYNYDIYKYIRENGGWDNWNMIEIEKFPCNNIKEALVRERYWLNELKANLNKTIPSRTQKEYYDDNRNKLLEYAKEYRERNENYKEKKAEYMKIWNEKNKEQKAEYAKIWREKNKEKRAEYKKEYDKNNKDKKAKWDKTYREKKKILISN